MPKAKAPSAKSKPKAAKPATIKAEVKPAAAKPKQEIRTPVVAVMGHVDHGKTSLLDALRGTRVTASEAGGITQNTRAHQITTKSGKKITFIDTPGHEAFSGMRQRGAQVTDFVLLVVAADDGIQPQTKQSIEFAKKAGVPIIVAVNKIDISGVNTTKIKQALSQFDVMVEEYGGDVLYFEVSATKGTGLDELVEGIELLAEVSELKPAAIPEQTVGHAFVLEASIDKRQGQVALCIMKSGSLDMSKPVFAADAEESFKVRATLDQFQRPVQEVRESDPFWVMGLRQIPKAGSMIKFALDAKVADGLQSDMAERPVEVAVATAEAEAIDPTKALLMKLLQQQEAVEGEESGETKKLNVIVKASTQGTLEAVQNEIAKFNKNEERVNVLYSAAGSVNESDIKRAQAAGAIVISFQLPADNQVERMAKQYKVLVRNYEIIYEMIDELEAVLNGMVEQPEEEVEVARAKVKQVFTLTDGSVVAGCEVTKGIILKGYSVYIERTKLSTKDTIAEIGRGRIASLRIQKNEVKEVKKGLDCGIILDPAFKEIEEGDEIVAYKVER